MSNVRQATPAPRVRGLPNGDSNPASADMLRLGGIPMIIEGVVDRWPATRDWSCETLAARCGDAVVETFITNSSLNGTVLQQINRSTRLTFAAFVEHIFGVNRADGEDSYYLRVGPGSDVFDALAGDIEVPDIGRPFNPKWTGLWMGQAGNVTPFHHDWWHGLLAQISGHKRYTLVHPFDGPALQKLWGAGARYDLSAAEILPEQAEVLSGLELCFEGVLAPGEMLYVPPYWFHQVVTLDDGNISMPTRFDTTQMPDVSLFQFSQDSCLRALTNQPVKDADEVAAFLKRNRRKFFEKEAEFIEALCALRGLNAADVASAIEGRRAAEPVLVR